MRRCPREHETGPMPSRYFDHLYTEICVAAGRRISRYGLWLLVWESGGDPDDLTRERAQLFIANQLTTLLAEEGLSLAARTRRRLKKSVLAFDPSHPTPEEWMTRTSERLTS